MTVTNSKFLLLKPRSRDVVPSDIRSISEGNSSPEAIVIPSVPDEGITRFFYIIITINNVKLVVPFFLPSNTVHLLTITIFLQSFTMTLQLVPRVCKCENPAT
jgi:hypothetical protein